jgi:hypothetical protein
MPGLTRQEREEAGADLGAPLGNSSLETFSKTLNSLKNGVEQGSDVALALVEYLYKSNSPIANKILIKYRTDCRFRKALRNATLEVLFNAGFIYSLRKDQSCITNTERAVIVVALASLGVNTATAISQYLKK